MSTALSTRCTIAGHFIGCRGKKGQESVSLTDLYKAADSPPNKDPREWLRHDDTREFIAFQARLLDVGPDHIVQTKKGGKGGGGDTMAYWVIALKYAAYLSKQLEDELIRAWRQLKEEEHDPDLAADMSFQRVKNYYLKQGYNEREAEELAAKRLIGKAHRNLLTGEWQHRGAQQPDFGRLTNAGYLGMYNKTAREMRQERGLPAKTNLRNYMGLVELAQTGFHEALTREKLQQQNVYGVQAMAQVSHATGKQLAQAVDAIRAPQLPRHSIGVLSPTPVVTRSSERQSFAS